MDRFSTEEEAFAALSALMRQARECRSLFEKAGVPLPARLLRFLTDGAVVEPKDADRPTIVVPAPDPPPRPTEWQEGWIWVPIRDANASTLVRGLLRDSAEARTPKDITESIRGMGRPEVSAGSVANIGTRLAEAGEIVRKDGFWSIADRTKPPFLHEEHAWGPPEVFETQEIAAYRRLCIIHVLKAQPDGLQPVQLTRTLQLCTWLHAPCNKDLVKMDLADLQSSQKIRRMGNTGKWRAV